MSKVNFTKLGLKKLNEVKTFEFSNSTIEVKQYLPVEDKLALISSVLNNCIDENNFANPLKVEAYTNLAIIEYYTNITLTDKQKEDAAKTYDLIEENKFIDLVIEQMDEIEYSMLIESIDSTIDSFYKYKNSLYGIMETINTDYKDLQFETDEMAEKMSNPESLALLKDVMTKLG